MGPSGAWFFFPDRHYTGNTAGDDPMLPVRRIGHVQVAIIDNVPLFFQERDGPWCPTLRILHQYPDMMPKLRADKGAIKFVLSGANIMCPGLTSPGATLHVEVQYRIGWAFMYLSRPALPTLMMYMETYFSGRGKHSSSYLCRGERARHGSWPHKDVNDRNAGGEFATCGTNK